MITQVFIDVRDELQESKLPVINEVLFLPNPLSPHVSERRTTIEIYRPDTSFDLSGCVVENDAESFREDLRHQNEIKNALHCLL